MNTAHDPATQSNIRFISSLTIHIHMSPQQSCQGPKKGCGEYPKGHYYDD